jgi:hypothetical protein
VSAKGDGQLVGDVTELEAIECGNSQGSDPLFDQVEKFDPEFEVVIFGQILAFWEGPENDSASLLELFRHDELNQVSVNAVGLFIDVFKKKYFILCVNLVPGAKAGNKN